MSDPTEPLDHLDLVPLAGSERPPAPGLQPAAAQLPSEAAVQATLVLRRKNPVDLDQVAQGVPDAAAYLRDHGADPADVDLVASTLTGLGLTVLESDAPTRRVRVEGPAPVVARIFGTELDAVTSEAPGSTAATAPRVEHRHRSGGLSIPRPLDGVVTAVLGLDDRPQARAQFRIAHAEAVDTSFTPVELGRLYAFPEGTDGTGQTVAIIELGGGFAQSDLDAYFGPLGVGSPNVTSASVDGATNQPGETPPVPTARSCSTSRWSAPWRPAPTSSCTSRRTPTPASSTP